MLLAFINAFSEGKPSWPLDLVAKKPRSVFDAITGFKWPVTLGLRPIDVVAASRTSLLKTITPSVSDSKPTSSTMIVFNLRPPFMPPMVSKLSLTIFVILLVTKLIRLLNSATLFP